MKRVLNCDCSLFAMLYEGIVEESKYLRGLPGKGSPEHIQTSWEWACQELCNRSCGQEAKTSRWWSWEDGSSTAKSARVLDLLVLTFLGIQKKWWKGWENSPLRCRESQWQGDVGEELPGEDAPGHEAAEHGADDEAAEGPSSHRFSIAAGRKAVKASRARCPHTSLLHESVDRGHQRPLERWHGIGSSATKAVI